MKRSLFIVSAKDGSLADKIHVNENTGWFRSAYGR